MPKSGAEKSKGGGRWMAVAGLALVALVALALLRRSPAAGPDDEEGPRRVAADAVSVEPVQGLPFQRLQGRWLRSDGDYLLDLQWVGSDGRVEAAYFNPRPVQVSRAEALEDDGKIKLLVELRDVGYPGCVYTLHYAAETDRMTGSYYQAAMRESFTVEFSRYRAEERPRQPSP